MSKPKIVIDTCSIMKKDFQRRLAGYTGLKEISVITYMEYGLGLLDRNRSLKELDELLKNLKITVRSFGLEQAARTARIFHEMEKEDRRPCGTCEMIDWNDGMKSSFAVPSVILVTENERHFKNKQCETMNSAEFTRKYIELRK